MWRGCSTNLRDDPNFCVSITVWLALTFLLRVARSLSPLSGPRVPAKAVSLLANVAGLMRNLVVFKIGSSIVPGARRNHQSAIMRNAEQ